MKILLVNNETGEVRLFTKEELDTQLHLSEHYIKEIIKGRTINNWEKVNQINKDK